MESYRFLPWLRTGMAQSLTQLDPAEPTSPGEGPRARAVVSVELTVNQQPLTTELTLYGPGDVATIDARLVKRRDPRSRSIGFLPHLFPSLEFHAPDFPWRFTPARGDNEKQRLRPFLCLIALERQPGQGLTRRGSAPNPVVVASGKELPDLAQSHAWAHAQVSGPFTGIANTRAALLAYMEANPERVLSRVVCPRRLRPQTSYLVCLVPTFAVGREAGLGGHLEQDGLAPAWHGNEQSIELPVYDSWSFTTGAEQDFELEVRKLKGLAKLPEGVGALPFRLGSALTAGTGPDLGAVWQLQGALRPATLASASDTPGVPLPSSTLPSPGPEALAQVGDKLGDWINRSAGFEVVGPPLYGTGPSEVRTLTADAPDWIEQLNLDPRHRIAASLGAEIVRREQDTFVQEAWAQAGDLRSANRLLRSAQLVRTVSERLYTRHLGVLSTARLLQVSAPAHGRVRAPSGSTSLRESIRESDLPTGMVEGAFRRLSRTRLRKPSRAASGANAAEPVLLRDAFAGELDIDRWEIVDEGKNEGPSRWEKTAHGFGQLSNIVDASLADSSTDLTRPGTMAVRGDGRWRDIMLTLSFFNEDDDGIGFLFRYIDPRNYYRLYFDKTFNHRKLIKCVDGEFQLLWRALGSSYQQNRWHKLTIWARGDNLRAYLDGAQLFDLQDGDLTIGKIGLHCWANAGLHVKDIEVVGINPGLPVLHESGVAGASLGVFTQRDEGNLEGPSAWTMQGSTIIQSSNISDSASDELSRRGTTLLVSSYQGTWSNVRISAWLSSSDDDGIGLVFRHRDANNFYRLIWDAERTSLTLAKCVNGQFTQLGRQALGYLPNSWYRVVIWAEAAKLRVFIDGVLSFDVRDSAHATGVIGLFSWGSSGAKFRDVTVYALMASRIADLLMTGLRAPEAPAIGPGTETLSAKAGEQLKTIEARHSVVSMELVETRRRRVATARDAPGRSGTARDATVHVGAARTATAGVATTSALTIEATATFATTLPSAGALSLAAESKQLTDSKAVLSILSEPLSLKRIRQLPDAGYVTLGNEQMSIKEVKALLTAAAIAPRAAAQVRPGLAPTLDSELRRALSPRANVQRANERITADAWEPADPLAEIVRSPSFGVPLCEKLRDIDAEMMLPGLAGVPENSVSLLETNPQFVEALLVGANHELAAELTWRAYPVDTRSTFFQRFWDVRGTEAGSAGIGGDIDEIRNWRGRLGEHVSEERQGGRAAFLIRSSLFKHFPEALCYCVASKRGVPQHGQSHVLPTFRGTLAEDMTYVGFDMSPDALRHGGPFEDGFFFVVAQRPTAPRFGLDPAGIAGAGTATSWNDLSWEHVSKDAPYLTVNGPAPLTVAQPAPTWGHNSAHMASITLQRPVRVAIHVQTLFSRVSA